MHELVHLWKVLQIYRLEGGVNKPALEEVKSFRAVCSVADVRSLDSDHLEHRLEHWGANVGSGGKTDHNDSPSGSNVFGGLLEWLFGDGHKKDGVGSKPVRGRSSHVLSDVARFGKVNESLNQHVSCCRRMAVVLSYRCTHLLTHGLLLGSRVNCNDMQTHCLGVLLRQGAEATTSADDCNGLARPDAGLLQALVDSDLDVCQLMQRPTQ